MQALVPSQSSTRPSQLTLTLVGVVHLVRWERLGEDVARMVPVIVTTDGAAAMQSDKTKLVTYFANQDSLTSISW